MASLIIASISDGAGKSALAAALAAKFSSEDAKATIGSVGDSVSFADFLPENNAVSGSIDEIAGTISGSSDLSIIEGTADATQNLDLAEKVDGLILLVVRHGEDYSGTASQCGSRLAGVVVNNVPKYRTDEDASIGDVAILGSIPDDRRMLAPKLGQVAEHLGGTFLAGDEDSDRLLDNFLIGGLVLDWGPFYFSTRKNTGVIVRGDRPDVQLAAIQTDTTQALILTKGVRPVEYVMYEAAQVGVPLVVVPGNTHDVAEQLESLQPKVGFDHPDKLARMIELVEQNVDLDAISDKLAQPATK